MGFRHAVGWALPVGQTLAGFLAWRNYREIPALPYEGTVRGRVSIIIPARNEEGRLPTLLRSLRALAYPDLEIVVVDDNSSDGTAQIAAETGARVLPAGALPPGWTGKAHACWVGAQATQGEWLLFTDADTEHSPQSLRQAVAGCRGFLSLITGQRCYGFWERLLLPYVYALYFVGARGAPIANGQYILVHRAVYQQIGGHEAVRSSVIEDVALARVAAAAGIEPQLFRAEDRVRVRMYDSLPALWEGLTKNAVRFVAISPRTGIPTVLAGMAFNMALPAALRSGQPLQRCALLLLPALTLLPWERRFTVPAPYAVLAPLASLVFQVLALDSIRRSLTGTTWRGRRYP